MLNDVIGENSQVRKMSRAAPEGFFQCAIFYGAPIAHELDCYETIRPRRIPKALRDELENQKFVFPFYSQEIFSSQKQAEAFFPEFINQLISKGFLPDSVVDMNKMLRDDLCKAAVVPLKFSVIEEKQA